MNTGDVTNGTAYMPGIGFDDPSLAETPAYLGTDLIGTTRRITGSPGGTGQGGTGVSPVIHRSVLTAFGEPLATVGSTNTRYTYAGSFGYETPEQSYDPLQELGWLHVGERYYDPAIGRFMQRDPIGIRGTLNTYIYVLNNPLTYVDPTGLKTSPGKMAAEAAGGATVFVILTEICGLSATGPLGGVIIVGATIVGAEVGGNLHDDPGPIERAIEGWILLGQWIIGYPSPPPYSEPAFRRPPGVSF